jgi:D-beta-D-heptose 7-phosphate kinase/D-beta-D-heptose 1-phosphate adenosyltransferase
MRILDRLLRMSQRLIDLIKQLEGRRVLLAGDFMLDRYIFGKTERISPEAPIPVLRFTREEQRLGGAGFVAAAVAKLGGRVTAIGVVGDDASGRSLIRLVDELGVDARIVVCPGRPTIDKVRLLGSSEDRTPQQMIRLDIEQIHEVDAQSTRSIIEHASRAIDQTDALLIEDYNKGTLSPAAIGQLIALARDHSKPVLIDPARLDDYSRYRGATLLKLNRPEAERATQLPAREPEQWPVVANRLIESLDLQAVVITLNDRGSYLHTRAGGGELLASRARQVADATGAGDMVLATLGLALAAGATLHDAVALGNVAAGLEVERLGCVPITPQEVVADLLAEHASGSGKERSLDRLQLELNRHRAAGRRIVFTNGCFDLIHLGHVEYFRFAKAQGDLLVVGVNTDASIRRLKGDKRPVVNEDDRIGVLEELESIDYLVRFDTNTPIDLIRAIRPDVLVKGADYRKDQVVGHDVVEGYGGHVALAPLIDGRSTSNVIRKILEAYSGPSRR